MGQSRRALNMRQHAGSKRPCRHDDFRGLGFRGLGFRGLGFRVWGLGFRG